MPVHGPVYVLEYLLGMYRASNDEATIQKGLQMVSTPSAWNSSPRTTLGRLPRCSSPSTMCRGLSVQRCTTVRPLARSSSEVGVLTYGASFHPYVLPTMPQASRGEAGVAPSQSPQVSFKVSSNASRGSVSGVPSCADGRFVIPQGFLRISSKWPSASKQKARKELVPQSSATRRGGRARRVLGVECSGCKCRHRGCRDFSCDWGHQKARRERLISPNAEPAGRVGVRCRSGRGALRGAWRGTDGDRLRWQSRHLLS